MDPDYSTYVDAATGTPTRDYTQTYGDLSQAGVQPTGYSRSGLPIINTDNDAWTRQFLGGAPSAVTQQNWAAIGMAPPNPGPSSFQGATGPTMATTGGHIAPIPGAMPVPSLAPVPQSPADLAQLQANNTELSRQATWAKTPVMGVSDPGQLAQAQRTRAAWIPGGSSLLSSLSTSNPNSLSTGAGDVSNLVTNAEGKKQIGDDRLNLDLLSDPRFQQLQANNADNASRFYEAVTGRSMASDLQAHVAQITTQRAAQDKLATETGQNLTIADKDDPNTGVKKGDFVKRQVTAGIMPGTLVSANVPLTVAEKQSVGIGLDGNIQGNSMFHRATGLYGAVDVQAMQKERDRLTAKSTADDQATQSAQRAATYQPGAGGMTYGGTTSTSNKLVPFNSPLYNQPSSASRDMNAVGSSIGQWPATIARVANNSMEGAVSYFTGAQGNYYKDNDSYMQAMNAKDADMRQRFGDNYDQSAY